MTYEQGIKASEKLLNQLQTTNQIKPKDSTEYAILHDALISYIGDLENELHRQKLVKEFKEFGQKKTV